MYGDGDPPERAAERLAVVAPPVLQVKPREAIREQRDDRIVKWGLVAGFGVLITPPQADCREPLLDGTKELPGVQAGGIGVAMSRLRLGAGPFEPEGLRNSKRQRLAGNGVKAFELSVDRIQTERRKRFAWSQRSFRDEVLHTDEVEIASQRDWLSRSDAPHPGKPLGDRMQAAKRRRGVELDERGAEGKKVAALVPIATLFRGIQQQSLRHVRRPVGVIPAGRITQKRVKRGVLMTVQRPRRSRQSVQRTRKNGVSIDINPAPGPLTRTEECRPLGSPTLSASLCGVCPNSRRSACQIEPWTRRKSK